MECKHPGCTRPEYERQQGLGGYDHLPSAHAAHLREMSVKNRKPRYCFEHRAMHQNLRHKYGITIEQYEQMYEQQGGCCKICQEARPPQGGGGGKRGSNHFLLVDHDHETGVVRGLLCWSCNVALGHLGDNAETLKRAIAYLEGVL